jgi:hypothetical protein
VIRYALHCEKGHDFEAWFRSSADYDAQLSGRHLSCPNCGSNEVAKSLMAPAVGKRSEEPAAAPPS